MCSHHSTQRPVWSGGKCRLCVPWGYSFRLGKTERPAGISWFQCNTPFRSHGGLAGYTLPIGVASSNLIPSFQVASTVLAWLMMNKYWLNSRQEFRVFRRVLQIEELSGHKGLYSLPNWKSHTMSEHFWKLQKSSLDMKPDAVASIH